jgi:hypothetical protein
VTYTFRAEWPIEPHALDVPMAALRREALRGPLAELLHEAGATLLCRPEEMAWRIDSDTLNLVAEGPAERAVVGVAA